MFVLLFHFLVLNNGLVAAVKEERDVFQELLSSYYLTNWQTFSEGHKYVVLKFLRRSSQEFKRSRNCNSEIYIV